MFEDPHEHSGFAPKPRRPLRKGLRLMCLIIGAIFIHIIITPFELAIRLGETFLALLMISAAFLLPIAIFWLAQTGWAEWRAWLLLAAGIVIPATAFCLQFNGDRIIEAKKKKSVESFAHWLERWFDDNDEHDDDEPGMSP